MFEHIIEMVDFIQLEYYLIQIQSASGLAHLLST
jgi:hypothetical protein